MEKKLYTFLFAACAAAMSASLSASAEETGPRLIREDRVWEYVYTEYDHLPTFDTPGWRGHQLFRVKFDGTEQHGEHLYHRLVHTGDLIRWTMKYDENTDDLVFAERRDVANDNSHVCLMREEEGRVYLLNKDMGDSSWHIQGPQPDEFLVYDFNKTAGESYELWSGIWYWNQDPEWHIVGEYGTCGIVSTDMMEIDGEECLTQYVDYPHADNMVIIEGIGFSEYGFLAFLYADDRTCMSTVGCDLNRVYNAEGGIIYRGLDIDPETVSVEKVYDKSSLSLNYGGEAVFAENPDGTCISLSLLDISGTVMSRVSGTGSVSASTAALTPGVYVAVAEVDGATVARRKFVVG